jgi:hypothetical protein
MAADVPLTALPVATSPAGGADLLYTVQGAVSKQTTVNAILAAVAVSGFIKDIQIQTFLTSGTYTPSAGMVFAIGDVWASGGGSGGVIASQIAATGGGGAGGHSQGLLTAAQVAADGGSETVTVGVAGTAGPAGNNPGGAGHPSSIGVRITANGGQPSNGGAIASTMTTPGVGGAAGVGNIFAYPGQDGEWAKFGAVTYLRIIPGGGGQSPAGNNSFATMSAVPAAYNDATMGKPSAASGFAAGGSGAFNSANASAVGGAAGAPGYVTIMEFCTI